MYAFGQSSVISEPLCWSLLHAGGVVFTVVIYSLLAGMLVHSTRRKQARCPTSKFDVIQSSCTGTPVCCVSVLSSVSRRFAWCSCHARATEQIGTCRLHWIVCFCLQLLVLLLADGRLPARGSTGLAHPHAPAAAVPRFFCGAQPFQLDRYVAFPDGPRWTARQCVYVSARRRPRSGCVRRRSDLPRGLLDLRSEPE